MLPHYLVKRLATFWLTVANDPVFCATLCVCASVCWLVCILACSEVYGSIFCECLKDSPWDPKQLITHQHVAIHSGIQYFFQPTISLFRRCYACSILVALTVAGEADQHYDKCDLWHSWVLYVCILRAWVQPTLDPYAEAFIAGPLR